MSNTDFEDDTMRQFGTWGPPAQMHGFPPFPGPPWGWHHGPGCGCGHCGPFPPECRPPCPPAPGWDFNWRPPVGAIRGPIIGVTDGSFAKAGEVGEYLYAKNTLTITAAQTGVPQFLASLVIPPGDWDCTLTGGAQTIMTGFNASLDPVPPNIRIPGDQAQIEVDLAPSNINIITGMRSFALTNAQPQLITVNYHAQGITASSYDANGVTGQITVVIVVDARRVR